jgi:polyphosphate kinase 2 (PPK2 family)
MLEVLDLRKKLEPTVYRRVFPKLQEKLRQLQYAVHETKLPVIIALEGWDASGRGEIIKQLSEVLDPRMFRARPGTAPTPLERRYHFLWRYQVALPDDGEMTLFDHSWYGRVLVERVDKIVPRSEWQQAYEQINEFERWLADDNQVLCKFWLHISKKDQKKRFKAFQADPNLSWKITKEYKRHHRQYEKWVAAVEEMLEKTDSPHAPWTLVEATDPRWARVKVFQVLIQRIEEALARQAQTRAAAAPPAPKAAEKAAAADPKSEVQHAAAVGGEKAPAAPPPEQEGQS